MKNGDDNEILEGTTRKVFRFIFHQHDPVGIHDIQRGLGLSSPSVAHYHVSKLLKAGLVREEGGGYVADRTVFENVLRIRRNVLPFQTAYALFFLTGLAVMLTILRPAQVSSTYVFALILVVAASAVTSFEAYKATRAPI